VRASGWLGRCGAAARPAPGIMERMPVTLTRGEFEDLVAEALDLIPDEFTTVMDNVVILVEDRHPTRNLYGLYHGVALTARTSHYSGHLPDTITIYRDPILRHARTVDEARDQVATTVIHEVAHHFGIDDDRLEELGWG
jgi:predicted Zn-dependent protease with MMP-like domain